MNSALSLTSIVRRHRDMLVQNLDDDLVMADLESGQYFGLAKTARRIWELIEQPVEVSAVCEVLAREYEVAPEVCASDVLEFLGDLKRDGLLHVLS